jgi:hypothetical protein
VQIYFLLAEKWVQEKGADLFFIFFMLLLFKNTNSDQREVMPGASP